MVALQTPRLASGSVQARAARRYRRQCSAASPVSEGQLCLQYQPKVDLRTGHMFGVEALMRWRHPRFGLLAPEAFIPQAERAGTIGQFDTWAIQESCRQVRLWDVRAEFSGSVAVNVSALELTQPEFIDVVFDALERNDVAPSRLVVEVTESLAIDHMERAVRALSILSRNGVRVALDDFGTGYSSLMALRFLPLSEVKVDHCFVKDITTCVEDLAIVTAIVAMATAKGAIVVAEGVEKESQLVTVARLGCHAIQGYLTGKPMAPEQLARAVAEHETRLAPREARTTPAEPQRCALVNG